MNPGLVVKLRPSGPWRIGPDSGARNRVDVIYHSDSLYSAITAAMSRLGWLEEWLDATARTGLPAVSFSSCFPYLDELVFVVPPRTVWPPASPSAKAARVRWRSARFVPLSIVRSILAGERLDENHWAVDGPSGCLVPAGKSGPFRTAVRSNAGVDRLSGSSERHSTACIEFRAGSGLWTVVSFEGQAAQERWSGKVKAAFRLLADTGFGGERSRGWGRSDAPEFTDGMLPDLILPLPTERAAATVEPEFAEAAVIAPTPVAPLVVEPEPEAPLQSRDREGADPNSTNSPEPETPAAEAAAILQSRDREGAVGPEPPAAEHAPVATTTAPEPEAPAVAETVPAPEGASIAAAVDAPAAAKTAPDLETPAVTETVSEPAGPVTAAAVDAPAAAMMAPQLETPTVAETVPAPEGALIGAAVDAPAAAKTAPDLETPAVTETVSEPAGPVTAAAANAPVEATATPEPPAPVIAPASAGQPQAPAGEVPPVHAGAPTHPHWLLSLFAPATADSVDWRRGNYTVLARGGRVDSPAGSGELKKQIQMVAEGSVLYAETTPRGSAADVAPDGFAHPVFRAGFAVAIPLPEVR